MTDGELRTPATVTVAALIALALLVGGLHGDGHLSERAAYGALTGLALGGVVLAVAAIVVHHQHGGPTSE